MLLIQHRAAGYWGFPKGHPEEGETPQDTAIRELREETALELVRFISEKKFDEQYSFTWRGKLIRKTVSLFVAEVSGEVVLQVDEVCASQWVPLKAADRVVTYQNDKAICREAFTLLHL